MHIYSTFIVVVLISLSEVLTVDVMPKLKKNVLNFRYGANFKYEGMLTHSFGMFYVVARYEIPKVEHLQFTTFSFDLTCNHLNISRKKLPIKVYKTLQKDHPLCKIL